MIYCAAIVIALIGMSIASRTATANSLNGDTMRRLWSASDRCAAAAQKQFPDYTPESNAKRDNAMKQCLASSNLPPRGDLNH